MAYIELPKLYHPDFSIPGRKPVGGVEIDWANPLARGLKVCLYIDNNRYVDLVSNKDVALSNSAELKYDERGAFFEQTVDNSYVATVNIDRFNGSGDFTLYADCYTYHDGATADNASIIYVGAVSGTTKGYATLNRGYSGRYEFKTYANYSAILLNSANHIGGRDEQVTCVRRGNALEIYEKGALVSSNSPSSAVNIFYGSGARVLFMQGQSTINPRCRMGLVWDRALSETENAVLASDPYQILRPSTPMFYFTSAGGGSLVVQSLAQSQSVGAPSLTQDHNLSVNGLDQAQSIDQPSLTQQFTLAANGLSQAQTIDNVELTQAHILTTNGLAQNQLVSSTSLTQHNVLSVDNANQPQSVGNITLSVAGNVSVNDLIQSQAIDNSALTQHGALTVNGVEQSQTIGNIALVVGASLAVQGLSQNQSISGSELTQQHLLTVLDVLQSQSVSNVELTVQGVLSVADISQDQLIDATTLAQHHSLTVQNLLQSVLIDNSALDSAFDVSVNNLSQSQSITQPSLTQLNVISVDDITQAQLIDVVSFGGAVIGYLRGEIVIAAMHNGNVTITKLLDGNVTLN